MVWGIVSSTKLEGSLCYGTAPFRGSRPPAVSMCPRTLPGHRVAHRSLHLSEHRHFFKNRRFCTVTWETEGQANLELVRRELVRQWCRGGTGLVCVGTQIWLWGCGPGDLGIRTWDLWFSRTGFKSQLSYFIAVQSPLASELTFYPGNGK